jgi:Fungal Zn(2)-Cys(6) binuclear cluster domain
MASPNKKNAKQVCSTCKTRKKGCDKQLPSCGYCSKRNLRCIYDEPPTYRHKDSAVQERNVESQACTSCGRLLDSSKIHRVESSPSVSTYLGTPSSNILAEIPGFGSWVRSPAFPAVPSHERSGPSVTTGSLGYFNMEDMMLVCTVFVLTHTFLLRDYRFSRPFSVLPPIEIPPSPVSANANNIKTHSGTSS